jgi:hypothetical protein
MTPPRIRRGWCRAAVLLAALLLVASCRVGVDVVVDLDDDGSGSVEVVVALDDDAVARLGGDLDAVLELDDLRAAGWSVEVVDDRGGGAELTAAKAFRTPDEAEAVLEEVSGPGGVLQDFEVDRSTPFARTEWSVRGVIDLRDGIEAFGDDDLAAELDGLPIGRSVEALQFELGEPLDEVLRLAVEVRLPGSGREIATTEGDATDGHAAEVTAAGGVWRVPLGEGPVRVEVSSSERRTPVLVWFGVGALLATVLVVLLLVRGALAVRRRRRRSRPAHAAGSASTVAPPA